MMTESTRTLRIQTFFLGIISTILVVAILKTQSELILPFVIAALLARLFQPSIDWLSGKGLPKGLSLLAVLIGAGVLMAVVSGVVAICAQQMGQTLPLYADKANDMMHSAGQQVSSIMTRLGADAKDLDMSHSITPEMIVGFLTAGFGSALSLISTSLLVLFLMLMIITGTEAIFIGVKAGYGDEQLKQTKDFLHSVDSKVQKFLVSKTLVNLITGTATYIILSLFGVDLAFVFAVLTFFLSYIPAIGGLVALLLPILMATLQFNSGGQVGGLVAALLVMNLTIDRFLEPKLMGKSLALSPLVVFVSFILFTWLWGAIGALIAVPITAIMKVAFEKTKTFRPVALMMGE